MTQLSSQVTLPEKAAVTINCTYLATRHPLFFGMFSIQEKVHSSSWKPRRKRRRESANSLKPHTTENQNPPTWRKPQSKSHPVVYYCALSDTGKGTSGGAEHTLSSDGGLGAERLSDPLCGWVYGVLSLSLWLLQNSYKCAGVQPWWIQGNSKQGWSQHLRN